ncbi:MAG: glycosyltransferase family 4 protein, partial [Bacteroidota bacterium]
DSWGDTVYDGIKVHYFRLPRILGMKPRNRLLLGLVTYLYWFVFQVAALIRTAPLCFRLKPEFIYGHTSYAIPSAFLLSRLLSAKCIYRAYGTFLADKIGKPLSLLVRFYDVLGFILPVDLLVLTDDGTSIDRVAKYFGVPDRKVRHWRNGVDYDQFVAPPSAGDLRKALGLSDDAKILLSVCRLVRWKRVDRVISSMPTILRQVPDVHHVIVGDGSERPNLEALARDLGVAEHVHFVGFVPRERLPEFYAAADIFCSTNEVSNVGNPLLEAMSAGKCVVVTAAGDTLTVVHDGVNGRAFPEDWGADATEGIVELLKDPAARMALGTRAQEYAKAHFYSWDHRMNLEAEALRQLLSAGSETGPTRDGG